MARSIFAGAGALIVAGVPTTASLIADVRIEKKFGWGFFIFRRIIGFAHLAAFFSILFQIEGLIGRQGILPFFDYFNRLSPGCTRLPFWCAPSVLWWFPTDAALVTCCCLGMLAAMLLMLGILPVFSSACVWILYLSIANAGPEFFLYQWDTLLLEATLLALFSAPLALRDDNVQPPSLIRWVVWLLLFRVLFSAGYLKFASGDPNWLNLDALEYHYATQPLPTWVGWYLEKLPWWFQHWSCGASIFMELIVPFLIFGPALLRRIAACGIVGYMLFTAVSGNFAFLNIVTIALAMTLFDDRCWQFSLGRGDQTPDEPPTYLEALAFPCAVVGIVQLLSFLDTVGVTVPLPALGNAVLNTLAPFQVSHQYGLFAVMTTERFEIELEGSLDGTRWEPYRFKVKPGDVARRPRWIAPLHQRLDWQMWEASLVAPSKNAWYLPLQRRLLEGSAPVEALFEQLPFGETVPKYIRGSLYTYRFTTREESDKTGDWWVRTYNGPYSLPTISRSKLQE